MRLAPVLGSFGSKARDGSCPVVVQFEEAGEGVPAEEQITQWIASVLSRVPGPIPSGEIVVRIEAPEEVARLSWEFMGKEGPTNVLSFPAAMPPGPWEPVLGDIVICPQVVAREAASQGKTVTAHWAHMVIHGTLHLLGYDHQEAEEAQIMEGVECAILGGLGFPAPYSEERFGD